MTFQTNNDLLREVGRQQRLLADIIEDHISTVFPMSSSPGEFYFCCEAGYFTVPRNTSEQQFLDTLLERFGMKDRITFDSHYFSGLLQQPRIYIGVRAKIAEAENYCE